MIVDRTRALEVLIGLPDVEFVGLDDSGTVLRIVIERQGVRPSCRSCGTLALGKGRRDVELVDLPAFGRPTAIVFRKHRWMCPTASCRVGSWTAQDPRIAAPRAVMTDRCARWCTREVGEYGRPVSDLAKVLGCDWHTVNDTVIRYGEALLDADTDRVGATRALGLDETLFARVGRYRQQCWSTQIVDVEHGVLLDIVEGRSAQEPCRWLANREAAWLAGVAYGTIDLTGVYRSVFDTMLPGAILIADPFHVVRVANRYLDECRRRVQNQTVGHRGRKSDPLYRARRRLTMARERLSESQHERMLGLLRAGDPHQEVWFAWNAKEVVRQTYDHVDHALAVEWVDAIERDFADREMPIEVRKLGRTIGRWKQQIVAWHRARFTNAPTEAINNLVKRVKRVAFGFRRFQNYRVRALLYAGRPNWHLLADITP